MHTVPCENGQKMCNFDRKMVFFRIFPFAPQEGKKKQQQLPTTTHWMWFKPVSNERKWLWCSWKWAQNNSHHLRQLDVITVLLIICSNVDIGNWKLVQTHTHTRRSHWVNFEKRQKQLIVPFRYGVVEIMHTNASCAHLTWTRAHSIHIISFDEWKCSFFYFFLFNQQTWRMGGAQNKINIKIKMIEALPQNVIASIEIKGTPQFLQWRV